MQTSSSVNIETNEECRILRTCASGLLFSPHYDQDLAMRALIDSCSPSHPSIHMLLTYFHKAGRENFEALCLFVQLCTDETGQEIFG